MAYLQMDDSGYQVYTECLFIELSFYGSYILFGVFLIALLVGWYRQSSLFTHTMLFLFLLHVIRNQF